VEMNEYEAETPEAEMTADDLREIGAKWLEKIRASERREKRWCRDAEAATKAFLNDDESSDHGKVYDFNILHSNIETIGPAIYNSTPLPDIRERFRSGAETPETAVSRVVAQVIERAILVQIDDGALDSEVEMEVQDALVAGRGIIRIRFDADEMEMPGAPIVDPATGMPATDEQGFPIMSEPSVVMTNERITFENVSWRDYREGPAKRWEDVPWVAYRHSIPWEEVQRIQDPKLKEILSAGGTGDQQPPSDHDSDTQIWEVWCKDTGKVYMIVGASGDVLSITDDPLGLDNFFPQGRPIQPITGSGQRTPVVPFSIYKKLADELDKISRRIIAITDGLKVRGLIAGDAGDIMNLADAGDNELVPIANLEGLAQTGGIGNAITWWPIEQAVSVLRELYQNREITKNMIYEVTGISDIIRGQGKASETATAQEIKNQHAGIRIRKLQRMVERHMREIFVLCAELISAKFSPETLQQMTGVQITPEMSEMLSAPLDHYRIDVESDSTVRSDLSRRKGEMGEFIQATAAYFNTMAPLVGQSPSLAKPVADIYGAFARQYSLGKQAEDAIEALSETAKVEAEKAEQEQGQPTPEQQAMMAEVQAKQQEREMKGQEMQAKMQLEGQRVQQDGQIRQAEIALDQERLLIDREKLAIDRERLTLDAQKMQMELYDRNHAQEMDEMRQAIQAIADVVSQMNSSTNEAMI
jgi:hypothetical protein